MAIVLAAIPGTTVANQFGLSGYSSSPHTNNGQTCVGCHTRGEGEDANLVLEGPSVVEASQTYDYTLRLTGGSANTAGVNISVDYFDGDLQARDGSLKKLINDLTHSRPVGFQNGTATFRFRWKAPAYNATTGIYAAANSSNGNIDLIGDSIATASLRVRVQNGAGTRPRESEPENSAIKLRRIASGLSNAVAMANAGDSRLFVVRQPGVIDVVQGTTVLPQSFLDIRSKVAYDRGEQGLLGLAFHPAYASNGYFFVNYTRASGSAWRTRISRFKVSANRDVADPGSETVILEYDRSSRAHNGGDLKFGGDGLLYVSSGEGGRRSNSQDANRLTGKILRIDVTNPPDSSNRPDCGLDTGDRYRIPAGNAFGNGPGDGCDEIFLLGLRNPWRISFDRQTDDLWIGDVGLQTAEEVNFVQARTRGGLNLGWPCYEGFVRDPSVPGCNGQYVPPIHTYYGENVGKSITGGFVYRGNRYPGLRGRYFFADYNYSGVINSLVRGPDGWLMQRVWSGTELTGISSFGEGADGELYVLTRGAGEVYAIEDAGGSGGTPDLTVSSVSVTEGLNNLARINVRLSQSSGQAVSVAVRTVAGSAKAPADFIGVSQRLTFNPGERTKSVDIEITDDEVVEPEESFDVRLSAPEGATISTGSASVRIDDDDTGDTRLPILSVLDAQVVEGRDTVARIQVRLSPAPVSAVTVNVSTTPGTATAPEDYSSLARQLIFNRGDTVRNIDIPLVDDEISETEESFQINLRQASGATIGRAAATVTIADDDAAERPTLSISGATVTEGINNVARVSVRLSSTATENAAVSVDTQPGTATAPSDYTEVSRRLTFAPGETVKNIAIGITNDRVQESTEHLTVRLSRPTGAGLAIDEATVTVNDDDGDAGSQLQLTATSSAVTEGVDENAQITLRLSEPAVTPVSVTVQSESITASEQSDYVALLRTLTFRPGQRQRDVDIAIVDDEIAEPVEQFQISLRQVTGAVVQTPTLRVLINDNDITDVDRKEARLKKLLKRRMDGMARRLARLSPNNYRDGPSRTRFLTLFRNMRKASRSGSLNVSSRIARSLDVRIDGCGRQADANDYVMSCAQQRQLRKQNRDIRVTLRALNAL